MPVRANSLMSARASTIAQKCICMAAHEASRYRLQVRHGHLVQT